MKKKKVLIRTATIVPNKCGFVPGMGRSTIELVNALLDNLDQYFEIAIYFNGRNLTFELFCLLTNKEKFLCHIFIQINYIPVYAMSKIRLAFLYKISLTYSSLQFFKI